VFRRRGLTILGVSLAVALGGGLLGPAAGIVSADSPYYVQLTPEVGSTILAVGGTTTLTIDIYAVLYTDWNGGDTVIVNTVAPDGVSLSNATGTCGLIMLNDNYLQVEQAEAAGNTNSFNSVSCTVSMTVTGVSAGSWTDTIFGDDYMGSASAVSVTPTFDVYTPPTTSASFATSPSAVGDSDLLTFTIGNSSENPGNLDGVAFSSTLPSGLTVTSGTSTVCGGTLTTTSPDGISLSGATIARNDACPVQVYVTEAAAGNYTVSSGVVDSTEGGAGAAGSVKLDVVPIAPPTIIAVFGSSPLLVGGTTSLSFTITNPNTPVSNSVVPAARSDPHDLTGVGFIDTLPSALVVATPNGLTGTCGGGTISAVAGSNTINLSGATLAGSSSCTFSVTVLAVSAGSLKNSTGPVSSNEGGAGQAASATLQIGSVATPPPTSTTTTPGSSSGSSAVLLLLLALIGSIGALMTIWRIRVTSR
jgi:uncharacterized repeat protein (TIGR01451 family)